MDSYYAYIRACVWLYCRCACVCIQQEVMEHGQRRSLPSCLFSESADIPCFHTRPNPECVWTKSELRKHLKWSFSYVGKGSAVSQRAFLCDDTKASFKALGFPSSFTFTPSSYTFFFFLLWVVGVVLPFQRFSSLFFREGLSSDRSLFPGFVSVICGHYINIHGWPEEWEKGCNTHPDPANH